MSVKYIRNAQVVTENGIIWDGAITIENGLITAVGKEKDNPAPVGAEIIDACGYYIGPGFVDIHCHAGNNFLTTEEAEKACAFLLEHGETSVLATTDYVWSLERHVNAAKTVREVMSKIKNLKGIYFEGPGINIKYGANARDNPWKNEITEAEYTAMVDAAGDLAKVWTIAPERPGIKNFMAYARKVNPMVRIAVGHSEATPKQIMDMGIYKPTIQTHSMNATGRGVPDRGGVRGYGPDEYCFRDPDVYCELISDSQTIHVDACLQQLLLHVKGVNRVILITDGTLSEGDNPEELRHITDLNFDQYGALCGSKMTMEQACKNVMSSTNCGIAQAFIMASTNPAKAVGLDDVGSIEVGKKADFVIVDDKFNLKKVIIQGEIL